jgi:nitrous oxide reductase
LRDERRCKINERRYLGKSSLLAAAAAAAASSRV